MADSRVQPTQLVHHAASSPVPITQAIPLSNKSSQHLQQIKGTDEREQYSEAIWYLREMAQNSPKDREILEKLLQHQEQLVTILRSCGTRGEKGRLRFSWNSLTMSNFWRITDKNYLIRLNCWTAAYNYGSVFFFYKEANPKPQLSLLKLVTFKAKNDKAYRIESAQIGGGKCPNQEHWYDQTTRELCVWERFLGVGTCGTIAKYRFQNDQLVLKEFTARFNCDPYQMGGYEKLYP